MEETLPIQKGEEEDKDVVSDDGSGKSSSTEECPMPELPPPYPLPPKKFESQYEPIRYGAKINILYRLTFNTTENCLNLMAQFRTMNLYKKQRRKKMSKRINYLKSCRNWKHKKSLIFRP